MTEEKRQTNPAYIHYTELTPAKPGERWFREWNTYLRELPRLLAEGHEGEFVLIKGEAIEGIFESPDAADLEGLRRYLLEPFIVQQIRTYEPNLRVRGYNFPWPVSISKLPKPA